MVTIERNNTFVLKLPTHFKTENQVIQEVLNKMNSIRPIEEQQRLIKTVTHYELILLEMLYNFSSFSFLNI